MLSDLISVYTADAFAIKLKKYNILKKEHNSLLCV